MKIKKLFPFAIAVLFLLSAVWVIAQEGKEMSPEQQKMMELMMKYGTPGEGHKLMEPFLGEWNIATKWWASPDAQFEESNGASRIEWILDGRFLMEHVEGMMDEFAFNGMGIIGYDNYGQKYHSLWIDNMSTMFWLQTGTANEDGSLFSFEGTWDDFMTGQMGKKSRSVIKVVNKDKRVMEMYDISPDGKEYKSMELTYTRKM
jgi:hypothetical protein